MATIPKSGVRPPGFVEDPNHPDYTGYKLVIIAAISLGLSTIFVMLRLFVRFFMRTYFGLDDLLIVIAWICGAILAIADMIRIFAQKKPFAIMIYAKNSIRMSFWNRHTPLGLPISTTFEVFLKLQMVVGCFYTATLPFAKISICILYLRLSAPGQTGLFQSATKAIIAFVICCSISGVLVIIFSCTPVNASWDLDSAANPGTRCVNRPVFYLVQASFNITSDIAIILAPQLTIWRLHMPLKQRISLMAIFAVGVFVNIVSIVRLLSLNKLLKSTDLTWDTSDVLLWSTLEAHVTIICACAPTLKPLIVAIMPNYFRKTSQPTSFPYPYFTRKSDHPRKLSDGLSEEVEFGVVERAKGNGNTTDVESGAASNSPTTGSQENILNSNVYVTKTVNMSGN